MSTATRRSLQVQERARAPISNGNGHTRLNSYGQFRLNGNGHAGNVHFNGAADGNSSNGNGASRSPKPRVFVAAENRLLREALFRMLTKNDDIEVIASEAAQPFQQPTQNTVQKPALRAGNVYSAGNPRCRDCPPLVQRKPGAGPR
jgi:hypothetical protein